jgi:hypothetical protein
MESRRAPRAGRSNLHHDHPNQHEQRSRWPYGRATRRSRSASWSRKRENAGVDTRAFPQGQAAGPPPAVTRTIEKEDIDEVARPGARQQARQLGRSEVGERLHDDPLDGRRRRVGGGATASRRRRGGERAQFGGSWLRNPFVADSWFALGELQRLDGFAMNPRMKLGLVWGAMAFALPACGGAESASESTASVADRLSTAAPACRLAGGISHVIFLVFDNVHFRRDNPNVPSDLEQMPHLLDFLTRNGTLDDNHHTPLIAHTATDILTALTGLYPDHHGMGVANTYRFFNPDGTSDPALSFAYWTDPIFDFATSTPSDTSPTMVTPAGKIAPAPWVAYTRAGCDFGAAGTANVELENIGVDIPNVFGVGSPQAVVVATNPDQATADFVGVAVHCAKGSPLCAGSSVEDRLPDEPGGYTGFRALMGQKYVAPAIAGAPLVDIDGNVISDGNGHVGFPGFNGMLAPVTLGYIATMQEAGIPITTGYISAAHEDSINGPIWGPGEAPYVARLKGYDDAFGKFFARLARDGITPDNTLFVITADENDHFAGTAPSPASCDGVHTPCTYAQIGQVTVSLPGLLAPVGETTPFDVATALALYVQGNPGSVAPTTRALERATASLAITSPYSGRTESVAHYIADRNEMGLLHMSTGDALRTPTFTVFTTPEIALTTDSSTCTGAACVGIDNTEVWVHGNVAPEINGTWLGIVGPGVKKGGIEDDVFSDHTDVRPTMLALLGLEDDYEHQGRVISEFFREEAEAPSARASERLLERLGRVYKQLNAPVGQFGLATLRAATRAIRTGSASDDRAYADTTSHLAALGGERDETSARIAHLLEGAWFRDRTADEDEVRRLIDEGQELIGRVEALAPRP